jgi:uncharacterized protein
VTKATVRVDGAGGDAVIVARDAERWSTLMPGVVSAKRNADGKVEWRISSPAGEALVTFEVTETDDVLIYRSVAADAPFTAMSMDVRVSEGTLELDFEIVSEPPFPPAMVESLAQTAAMRLKDAAAGRVGDAAPTARTVRIPMSDGKTLEAHLYRAPEAPSPCIVTLFPYRKEGAFLPQIARDLNAWGYTFLIADVRGIGGSDGPYEGLWSDREIADHVELIDWAAAQDWCDGNVATFGGSYCGGNQLNVAARRPDALRCITPVVGMVDTYRDWTHRGGIPSHTHWGAMTYLRSQQRDTAKRGLEQYYLDFYADDFDNDAHRARSPETTLGQIDAPTLAIGGWHDYFLRGTVRTYLNVSGPKRIVVGPWGHGDAPPLDELRRWFDVWLRADGELPATKARLFITGAEEWREFEDWPQPEPTAWNPLEAPEEIPVYPLVESLPMATNIKPQFMPDPTDSGMSVWSESKSWSTEVEGTCVGHVGCLLRLAVEDASDVDVRVRLSTAREDAPATQLSEGRIRLSHREIDPERSMRTAAGEVMVPWHIHAASQPLDGVVDVYVEIDPIGHEFRAGDRLQFGVTLTRSDEGTGPASAMLHPESRLLLPIL